MRGDIVHRIYGVHEGRDVDSHFGTFLTVAEAHAEIARLSSRRNWMEQYHNRGFVIREAVVETDFEIPSLPKPRHQYVATGTATPNQPGTWDSTTVQVFRRGPNAGELERVCDFERNYALLQTFEPFRQGGRDFALIARCYTKAAVLDLASGEVIAEEPDDAQGWGFCPVGFYVPDWWDVHDGSVIPGSPYWNRDRECPGGEFGFVWGCIWGDDSSWKIQYLDLSSIQSGVIRREERFGYVELATHGYRSPCLDPAPLNPEAPSKPPFISIHRYEGETKVTFAVEMIFHHDSGKCADWQRIVHPFD